METLKQEIIKLLRENGFLSEREVAYREGDLLVAKDVISNEKRVLENIPNTILESNKHRILKG